MYCGGGRICLWEGCCAYPVALGVVSHWIVPFGVGVDGLGQVFKEESRLLWPAGVCIGARPQTLERADPVASEVQIRL